MNAHFVTSDVWLDLHLSKVDYAPSDRDLFVGFVSLVRVGQLSGSAGAGARPEQAPAR
jgi:hypothetical protein